MNKTSLTLAGALVLASAFTLTACGDTEPSMKEQSQTWWTDISPKMDLFQADLNEMSSLGSYDSYSDFSSSCVALLNDVEAIQAEKPFPKDPVLWDHMLDTYNKAFTSCIASEFDDTLIYMTQGNADLEKIAVSAEELNINP